MTIQWLHAFLEEIERIEHFFQSKQEELINDFIHLQDKFRMKTDHHLLQQRQDLEKKSNKSKKSKKNTKVSGKAALIGLDLKAEDLSPNHTPAPSSDGGSPLNSVRSPSPLRRTKTGGIAQGMSNPTPS